MLARIAHTTNVPKNEADADSIVNDKTNQREREERVCDFSTVSILRVRGRSSGLATMRMLMRIELLSGKSKH